MRRLLLAAFIAVLPQGVHAADPADLPILRGSFRDTPPPRHRTIWEGVYAGGHVGYSSHDFDFSKTTIGLQEYLVRESIFADTVGQWQLLGSSNQRSAGFGGFVGYNFQFEDAVIGLEANYTRFKPQWATSVADISRILTNPEGANPPAGHTYEYVVTLRGDAAARVNDLLTLRARGGYTWGSFMPYAFGGLAMAFVDFKRAATVQIDYFDLWTESAAGATINHRDYLGTSFDAKSESQKNLLTFGFAAGLGFEYMLMSNIFARAEYEYVQLVTGKDTTIHLNTGRVGLGAKF